MSRKRSSVESNEDDQTNEGSESLFQRKDNNKRARFHSVSATTLEDLPIELLECILLKVVAMEVKALKLAKVVWEEKADLVIIRLRTVCPQWNNILTTNYFRKKLHRALDAALETKIRLEILHETQIDTEAFQLTTLKDDIFMLSSLHVDTPNEHRIVKIYDRNNVAEVKDVIPLPRSTAVHRMQGCNVSNCVYVLIRMSNYMSFLRIYKDTEDTFNVAPWECDHKLPISTFSVSANGNLLILSKQQQQEPHLVSIYNADGSLQHRIEFPPDSDVLGFQYVRQKSNGNLVVSYFSRTSDGIGTRVLEIDRTGSVVRQAKTSVRALKGLHFADIYGRIVLTEPFDGMKLLDSEFNLLGEYSLQQDDIMTRCVFDSHYDSQRSEIMRISYHFISDTKFLTIIRFTEE